MESQRKGWDTNATHKYLNVYPNTNYQSSLNALQNVLIQSPPSEGGTLRAVGACDGSACSERRL